jgi:hypothetical protein
MEPGPRPSTARQALPERSPVAGPSRPCSAARLALAGARRPAGRNRRGQRETAPRTKWAGGSRRGRSRSCSVGTPGGQLAPCTSTTSRPTEAAWPSVGATLADRWPSRCHGADLAVGRRTSYRRGQSTSGPRVLGPGRTRGTGRASARPVLRVLRHAHSKKSPHGKSRLVTSDWRTIESPGPTGDACSDAKSAFAKTSTARPWGGTQEPAGPQAGRFFALEQRPGERPGISAGVVPATGSPRSSPR